MELVVETALRGRATPSTPSGNGDPEEADERRADPRHRHAPVGQVGAQLRRVRRRRRPRRRSPTRRYSLADVEYLAAGDTMRNGYPGYVAGSTFAQALGWSGLPVSSSYAACASGAVALDAARARILAGLADVALVVGADTAPKGFFGPLPGERPEDPDWLRFHLLGATNPTYFGLYARRRMECFGATAEGLRRGQGQEQPPRPREPQRPLPQGVHRGRDRRVADRRRPVAPGRHLRDERRGRGRRARPRRRRRPTPRRQPTVRCASPAVSTVTPTYPNTVLDMPDIATDSGIGAPAPPAAVPRLDRRRRLRGGRPRAETTSASPRSTTSRPRSSSTGTRTSGSAAGRRRGAAPLGRDDARRSGPGQPERRPGVLRRGHPRAGARPGVRAASPSCAARRASGRSTAPPVGLGDQPGAVRSRLVHDPHRLTHQRPRQPSGSMRVRASSSKARRYASGSVSHTETTQRDTPRSA